MAGAVEAGQHLRHHPWRERGGVILEAELALLDELHAGERSDDLGHRCDEEHVVKAERRAGRDIRDAECGAVQDVVLVGDHRGDAWQCSRGDGLIRRRLELGELHRAVHVPPP